MGSKPVEEAQAALAQIKAVAEDGHAEINDRSYTFGALTFEERRSVFAYTSSIEGMLQTGNLSFIDTPEYKAVERDILFKRITVDGMSLTKRHPHMFEEFPEDYIMFVQTALLVISYPFLKGKLGG